MKLKIEMGDKLERKKLIRIGLIALMLMIGLIILENSIRGTKNIVLHIKENKESKEQEKAYEQTEDYKEELEIKKQFAEIEKLLNEKNVDELYDMLDDAYKDYKFENNKEKFETYIQKYMLPNIKLTLQDYELKGNTYKCRILKEESGEYTSFLMSFKKVADNDKYKLIFDNIISINKMEKKFTSKNIKCDMLYEVILDEILVYNVEYKNIGKTDIEFKCEAVTISDSHSTEYIAQKQDDIITLKPGETIRKNIIFSGESINRFSKEQITINLKDSNQNEIIISEYI